MTTTTVTHEMLAAAYEKYRQGSLDSTLLSLLALAQGARECFPRVQTIQFEWSDQGPFLSLSRLLDADGHDLDPDFTFDGESLDSNLADSCQGQWDQYMTDADGGGEIGRRTRQMNLDVDRALAIELPDSAIRVLHDRDPDGMCAIEVFAAGKRVDAEVEDVDPGRGYQWDGGWKDRLVEARDAAEAHPDDEFRQSAYQALLAATESEHVRGKPEGWREVDG